MSRRSARRGNGRGGSRRRHLVLLLVLGLFPIDTAMTAALSTEAGTRPDALVAPPCEIHRLQRSTYNPAPSHAGGVDRVVT